MIQEPNIIHILKAYVDAVLRGSGQVVFMNHPLTGLLNFAAFFWAAFAGGTTLAVALGAVIGTMIATATAHLFDYDSSQIKNGLYGFNGLLVGAAIPTFLAPTAIMWALLFAASALSTVVTRALAACLAPLKIPALTFPFVLTTWLVLLAAYPFSALEITGLPAAMLAVPAEGAGAALALPELIRASLSGISQIYLVDNPISGGIFLLAIAVASRPAALLALAGSALAIGAALLFQADQTLLLHGLWGYSAALTAVAVGSVFIELSTRALLLSLGATLFTILLQGASFTLASTVGIPALTFPFVLATWVFLLAKPPENPESAAQS